MQFTIRRKSLDETWRKWFAWHPVSIEKANGQWAYAWLETVERKETIGYGCTTWRYRELFNHERK